MTPVKDKEPLVGILDVLQVVVPHFVDMHAKRTHLPSILRLSYGDRRGKPRSAII